ncbi:hypothetical protein RvY_17774 [Ramazzottius varieornatus]|uniref:Uncharacterized protein n=1 Tax=Ramazzottius varieornatus TaxID=947166 RepID=A0A1D1W401_RAMVA|nr:hypothetical protein RvY_17774 [Ramazzottius varieornatus]
MDSVNPMNILKLPETDYEQHFQSSDTSSAAGQLLKTLIKDDFEAAADDRLTNYEPPSNETEPSSHELFFPRMPNPRVPFDQAADVDYKKRAVNFWTEPVTKKRRSLSSLQI